MYIEIYITFNNIFRTGYPARRWIPDMAILWMVCPFLNSRALGLLL